MEVTMEVIRVMIRLMQQQSNQEVIRPSAGQNRASGCENLTSADMSTAPCYPDTGTTFEVPKYYLQ